MTKIQQLTVIIAIVILKTLFLLTSLEAMLRVEDMSNVLRIPINWLPEEVSNSPEQLDDELVEQAIDQEDIISDKKVQCITCFEPYQENDVIAIFSDCRHSFHYHCIVRWLISKKTCAHCNQPASDLRIIVVDKAQREKPHAIKQGELTFLTMLNRLGDFGQPLVDYFNALPPKKKVFYSVMSALGIVLVAYLAYKWWTSSSANSSGSCSIGVTPELIELALPYNKLSS